MQKELEQAKKINENMHDAEPLISQLILSEEFSTEERKEMMLFKPREMEIDEEFIRNLPEEKQTKKILPVEIHPDYTLNVDPSKLDSIQKEVEEVLKKELRSAAQKSLFNEKELKNMEYVKGSNPVYDLVMAVNSWNQKEHESKKQYLKETQSSEIETNKGISKGM
jgi:hypothetical protein